MRYRALDGWRGLCALGVALFHFTAISHITVLPIVQHAYLLVDFFFALSGFIIAHTYLGRIDTPGEAGLFLVRRIGRLWPLHLATLLALAGWELLKLVAAPGMGETAPFTGARNPQALLEGLFLVHAWGASHAATWNVPSWSISVELAACIMFAGLCLVSRRRPALGAAVLAVIGLGGVIFIARRMDVTCDFGVLRGMAGFFLGVLVRLAPRPRLGPRISGLLEAGAIIAVFALLGLGAGTAWEFIAPALFAGVVWVFAGEAGPASAFLQLDPIQAVGRWSYSIYLIHFPLVVALGVVRKAAEKMTGLTLTHSYMTPDGPIQAMFIGSYWTMDLITLAYLALVICLAALSYRLIEQPGRDAFNGWAASLRERPSLVSA